MARMKSGMLAAVFVEEDHVQAQHNNVVGVKSSGVLFEVFKEVTRKDLVEESGAILEFVDVHLFHCDTNEILAAVLSCLPIFVVFSASFVDGLSLLHLNYVASLAILLSQRPRRLGMGNALPSWSAM
jgi:hypothetical protein